MGFIKMSFRLKLGQLITKLVYIVASVGLLITMATVVVNVFGPSQSKT